MIRTARRVLLIALVAAFTLPAAAQQGGATTESVPALPGSELARPALLKGPLHKVAEPVKVEGHLGRFEIESTVGRFSVHGANMLAVRVSELQAIGELQKVHKDSAFTAALSKSAGGLAKFAGSAVNDPGKAVENIGAGAVTVFGRLTYLAKSTADYAGDKAADATSSGVKPKAGTAPTGEPEPPSFTGDPFGYNQARREWAKKLNIDPYTTNPVLRPLLDNAASATFAGNFAVNLAVGAVAAPLQYAYSFDQTVRDSVWDRPAIDLAKENEGKLLALGVQGRTVRDLLRNRWFTPTLQTALTARLVVLGKVPGLESVVAAAAATNGEARARFLLESLAMLVTHHQKSEKLASVRMSDLVPVGVAANGAIIASAAIDYGTWDQDAAAFAQRKELAGKTKTLLVAGKVSARAMQELEKAGWIAKTGQRA